MNRTKMIADIANSSTMWDMLIIGGGATGIGTALDAASRGYKVLLVEQSDFGKGTSSRSTKLAHGGVRYLQQGNVSLVLEALKERGIMRRNAPHLVHDLAFIVPVYDWWEGPFYGVGLKLYDMLAGKEGFGKSKFLSKEETIKRIPTIETKGLDGGIIYYDGQFDDARLLINLAQTAYEQGASLANYMQVTSLQKSANGLVTGAALRDAESGKEYHVQAKVVINATGVFSDSIRKMDSSKAENIMTSSQGVHIVLDKEFLPAESAIMLPHTDDGRVLFCVPWQGKIIIGTTDTEVKKFDLEPKALEEEVSFLLKHAARYLTKDPSHADIKSVFVGLRPLVKDTEASNTAAISREHLVTISQSGLVTITGGKWTTYRRMAKDAVDQAIPVAGLDFSPCVTKELQLRGFHKNAGVFAELAHYGSDAPELRKLIAEKASYSTKLHANYAYLEGEVIWAARHEMARTVEDILARRMRLLFLDAKAATSVAEKVAELLAQERGLDENWQLEQVASFKKLAESYLG